MPKLDFTHDAGQHRYEIASDGELAGFVNYKLKGSEIELSHTEVLPAFSGKGVGGALAEGALADARKAGRKVVPSCSFIAGYLKKHPDQLDLVSPEMQDKYKLR